MDTGEGAGDEMRKELRLVKDEPWRTS